MPTPSESAELLPVVVKRLHELDDDIKQLRGELRGEMAAINVKLARVLPGAGQVRFLGINWDKVQGWVAMALLGGALWIFGWLWLDVRRLDVEDNILTARIVQLEVFASAGGRATREDLDVVRRCVLSRFRERRRALDENLTLPAPNPTMALVIDDCITALERLGVDLYSR